MFWIKFWEENETLNRLKQSENEMKSIKLLKKHKNNRLYLQKQAIEKVFKTIYTNNIKVLIFK